MDQSTKELNSKAMLMVNMWSLANIFLTWGYFKIDVVLINNTFGSNMVFFKPASKI